MPLGVLQVAVHAKAHLQRLRLRDAIHLGHVSVARCARDVGPDVRGVIETGVIGDVVHLHPLDGLGRLGGVRLTVRIESFSYQRGTPIDDKGHGGGTVFDCRALPNPGKYAEFASRTGLDPEVIAFLKKEPAVEGFLQHVFGLIGPAVENYKSRNFTDLVVAFGCTGGRHRSVYCAERLKEHLQKQHGAAVELRHRELEKIREEVA